jgi:hypothetical protein
LFNVTFGNNLPTIKQVTLMKTISLKNLFLIVILGLGALKASAQVGNTRYGSSAYPSLTGAGNSAFGAYSLNANTNGNYNTAIGTASLYNNTSGSSNTGVGRWSLYSNTSGLNNTSLGSMTMYLNTFGVENTAVGTNSLMQNTWGSYNTANGMSSLNRNTSGHFNTASGAYSLYNNFSGGNNTASGSYSMYYNGQGADNVANGMYSLYRNQTGNSNTALGTYALFNNQTGSNNTATGSNALASNLYGSNNTAVGYNTGSGISNGSGNTIIGANVTGLPSSLTNTIILADGTGNQRLVIDNTGKARIGSATLTTPGTYKLYVEQGILTEKVVVAIANSTEWADYVFAPGYHLTPLAEVEKFVNKNHHLPNVPSAREVVKNGVNLAAMDAKLLEKIEELTLYLIEQNAKNAELMNRNEALLKKVNDLENRMAALEVKK